MHSFVELFIYWSSEVWWIFSCLLPVWFIKSFCVDPNLSKEATSLSQSLCATEKNSSIIYFSSRTPSVTLNSFLIISLTAWTDSTIMSRELPRFAVYNCCGSYYYFLFWFSFLFWFLFLFLFTFCIFKQFSSYQPLFGPRGVGSDSSYSCGVHTEPGHALRHCLMQN